MKLADKVTTLGGMLSRADKAEQNYEFIDLADGRQDPSVVEIPVSLDQKRDTLRSMISHRTTITAEQHRLDLELSNLDREIQKHKVSFSKIMRDELEIPAPMASDEVTAPPAIPTSEE